MDQREVAPLKRELEAVREQFESWRKIRKRGGRIPQTLWDAAVKLTESHSVNEVSKVCRLEYNHLKRRVDQKDSSVNSTRCGFIELDVSQKMADCECAIEMQRPDGALMRVSIKGGVDSHLFDLVKAFWGRP